MSYNLEIERDEATKVVHRFGDLEVGDVFQTSEDWNEVNLWMKTDGGEYTGGFNVVCLGDGEIEQFNDRSVVIPRKCRISLVPK